MRYGFKDAKIGDKVWSSVYGDGKIVDIVDRLNYPIFVAFTNYSYQHTFDIDGRSHKRDVYPTLFWEKFDIPERPPLESVLGALKQIDGNIKVMKEEIQYNLQTSSWYTMLSCDTFGLSTVYFESIPDSVIKFLNDNKVTRDELIQVFKNLGWL